MHMTKPKAPSRSFASDNNAGVHPRILEAIVAANSGHVIAYGDDPYTEQATAKTTAANMTKCAAIRLRR